MRHVVVDDVVCGSRDSLTHPERIAVHFEHFVVQQLVHDRLTHGGTLDAADGVNTVIVVPVQKTQLHLVLEVVGSDADGRSPRLLENQEVPLVHYRQCIYLHFSDPLLWILKLVQIIFKVSFNKSLIAPSVFPEELHTFGSNLSVKTLAMQHLLSHSPKQARTIFGDLLPMQT